MGISFPNGDYYEDHFDMLSQSVAASPVTKNEPQEVQQMPQEEPKHAGFYLVRHGSTDMNAEGGKNSADTIRGWSDVPLNDKGRQEVQATADELKSHGITAIVSSDLDRAKETAQIIGRSVGVEPSFSHKLRPWDLGEFTGKPAAESAPALREYSQNPDKVVPGGESFNTFKERTFEGLREAFQQHPNDNLAIVAHHRTDRLLNSMIEGEGEIHEPTFMAKGEPPGSFQKMSREDIMSMTHQEEQSNTAKPVMNTFERFLHGGLSEAIYGEERSGLAKALSSPEANAALGMFGGKFSPEALLSAKIMENKGFSPSTIKEMTGLERGAEGMWRKEFSDAKARLKPDNLIQTSKGFKIGQLGDILEHKEFFNAYPEARKVMVNIREDLRNSAGRRVNAQYSPEHNLIALDSSLSPQEMKSSLMHEVQHWVQRKEGFALSAPKDFPLDFKEQFVNKAIEKLNESKLAGRTPEDIKNYAEFMFYKAQASEVEARNTQTRLMMSAKERKSSLGASTEDLGREHQVISGKQSDYRSPFESAEWSAVTKEDLQKAVNSGFSYGDIAEQHGVTRNAVIGKANRLGVESKFERRNWTPEEVDQLRSLSSRGFTPAEISKKTGIERSLVKARLQRLQEEEPITRERGVPSLPKLKFMER
jgi:broad specificity phosphatase PhoE